MSGWATVLLPLLLLASCGAQPPGGPPPGGGGSTRQRRSKEKADPTPAPPTTAPTPAPPTYAPTAAPPTLAPTAVPTLPPTAAPTDWSQSPCDVSKCYFKSGSSFSPGMKNASTTNEMTIEHCQARCASFAGCATFTFVETPDHLPHLTGECTLHDPEAMLQWDGLPKVTGPAKFMDCCFNLTRRVGFTVTFGAPASSYPAAANPGGMCLAGVRIFTESARLPGGGIGKQEDAAAMFTRFPHAKMPVLILRNNRDGPDSHSEYFTCKEGPADSEDDIIERMPLQKAMVYQDWSLHSIEHRYGEWLKDLNLDGVDTQRMKKYIELGVHLAEMAETSYMSSVEGAVDAVRGHLPGFRLVGYACVTGSLGDKDAVLLLQKEENGRCTVSFEGSDSLEDILSFAMDGGAGFCGFQDTHVGVRNELWNIVHSPAFQEGILRRLPKCNRVNCVGHSLGGALCDLFTLCANSNRHGDPDFDILAWEFDEEWELMDETTQFDTVAHFETVVGGFDATAARPLDAPRLAAVTSAPLLLVAVGALLWRRRGSRALAPSGDAEATSDESSSGQESIDIER